MKERDGNIDSIKLIKIEFIFQLVDEMKNSVFKERIKRSKEMLKVIENN